MKNTLNNMYFVRAIITCEHKLVQYVTAITQAMPANRGYCQYVPQYGSEKVVTLTVSTARFNIKKKFYILPTACSSVCISEQTAIISLYNINLLEPEFYI